MRVLSVRGLVMISIMGSMIRFESLVVQGWLSILLLLFRMQRGALASVKEG